ncbi:hypothetical protein [Nocardia transvalensis]|uniref:hypothetical protein n=1 Tax=Nocardia transvalensis TaxID=37333 RepID=UPI0018938DAF|nr:hypothetical protein [Nocardia transvalensis]MBF6333655.1 hypothetical protein [Nocardia transvalensis]
MSSTEPTHSFTLTEGQLVFLRYILERGFLEFLEYARDSEPSRDGFMERTYVDGFVELYEIFGMELPEVPEK